MIRRRIIGTLAVLGLLSLLLIPARVGETLAQWDDGESVTAQGQAAVIPPVLPPITCTGADGGLLPTAAVLTWNAPAGLPVGATYRVTAVAKTFTEVKYVSDPTIKISVVLLSDLLGLLLGSSSDVVITVDTIYAPTGTTGPMWVAASSATITIKYIAPVLGLLLGGFRCS
ncbi:hypothetical protein [Mycetocola sp. JXN-3]|uniref:hypothetical protein n=1 Tax=Mycetocola sp. JXN-3 TaxID=2116510 RepID=UPI00165D10DA|nr:hypothetical protein [Mycetocola sp. JXN-3]